MFPDSIMSLLKRVVEAGSTGAWVKAAPAAKSLVPPSPVRASDQKFCSSARSVVRVRVRVRVIVRVRVRVGVELGLGLDLHFAVWVIGIGLRNFANITK